MRTLLTIVVFMGSTCTLELRPHKMLEGTRAPSEPATVATTTQAPIPACERHSSGRRSTASAPPLSIRPREDWLSRCGARSRPRVANQVKIRGIAG